jgi:hypothetical protein
VPCYLAERYLAAGAAASLSDDVERIDSAAQHCGAQRLATVYVPTDEVCLFLFDAATAERVSITCREARVPIDRINAAVCTWGA